MNEFNTHSCKPRTPEVYILFFCCCSVCLILGLHAQPLYHTRELYHCLISQLQMMQMHSPRNSPCKERPVVVVFSCRRSQLIENNGQK